MIQQSHSWAYIWRKLQFEKIHIPYFTAALFTIAKIFMLLGRKSMTNLDSILKSKDITLPKVHLVKAMVFPVVVYGWES